MPRGFDARPHYESFHRGQALGRPHDCEWNSVHTVKPQHEGSTVMGQRRNTLWDNCQQPLLSTLAHNIGAQHDGPQLVRRRAADDTVRAGSGRTARSSWGEVAYRRSNPQWGIDWGPQLLVRPGIRLLLRSSLEYAVAPTGNGGTPIG